MRIPEWTWRPAWRLYLRTAMMDDADRPGDEWTPTDRRQVLRSTCWLVIKHWTYKPTKTWLQKHLPVWFALRRLIRRPDLGRDWYEVPNIAASVHLHRRLDCPCRAREGDLVRIEGGAITAFGWMEHGAFEFDVLPSTTC